MHLVNEEPHNSLPENNRDKIELKNILLDKERRKALFGRLEIYDKKKVKEVSRKHNLLNNKQRAFLRKYFFEYWRFKKSKRLSKIAEDFNTTIGNARVIKCRVFKKIGPHIIKTLEKSPMSAYRRYKRRHSFLKPFETALRKKKSKI
jgi:hypothetical protein